MKCFTWAGLSEWLSSEDNQPFSSASALTATRPGHGPAGSCNKGHEDKQSQINNTDIKPWSLTLVKKLVFLKRYFKLLVEHHHLESHNALTPSFGITEKIFNYSAELGSRKKGVLNAQEPDNLGSPASCWSKMFATVEAPFSNLLIKSWGELEENEPNAHHKPPQQLPFPILLSGSTQHLVNPNCNKCSAILGRQFKKR